MTVMPHPLLHGTIAVFPNIVASTVRRNPLVPTARLCLPSTATHVANGPASTQYPMTFGTIGGPDQPGTATATGRSGHATRVLGSASGISVRRNVSTASRTSHRRSNAVDASFAVIRPRTSIASGLLSVT